jgi:uncharacterized membrane protein YuzA (DUF378 family)
MFYNKVQLKILLLVYVIIGSLNWIPTAFGYNLVQLLNEFITKTFNNELYIDKIIYIIVGISALILAFDRNFWLPFLGDTVLPSTVVPLKDITGDTTLQINIKPNTKVIYWSSKPNKNDKPNVKDAYNDYSNAGVVMSDNNGVATLVFDKGTGYIVPSNKYIKKHVHYRTFDEELGILDEVKTLYY